MPSTFSEPHNGNSPANSSPPPTPLQAVADGGCGRKLRYDPREMQIVPANPTAPFQLPEGWIVEVRPRGPNSSIKMSDKYYYEPQTGRKFRSLVSVKRYLNGEGEILPRKKPSNCLVPYQNSGSLRRIVYDGKLWRPDELEEARYGNLDDIVPTSLQPKASSLIPDGWIVEDIPRKCGFRSDRYYIEPITGQKFRSLPEVQRYLQGEKKRSARRALAFSNHARAPRSSSTKKKNKSIKMLKDAIIDLTNPPEKINWVFSGDGRDSWSPLLEECMIPDYVKEQWSETFLLGMNGWKQRIPLLTMVGNNQG